MNRSYSLAATSIAIFTFMLFFLYPMFWSGEINGVLFQATLVVMGVATFSFVFAPFCYDCSSLATPIADVAPALHSRRGDRYWLLGSRAHGRGVVAGPSPPRRLGHAQGRDVSPRYELQREENIMKATMAALAAWALVIATQVSAQSSEPDKSVQLAGSKDAKVTLVYQHALPGVPGKTVKGVLVEYGPGGFSPSHTHAKSAFVYATVIEGEVHSKVNDGPVTTYRTGENWSELSGDHHGVSANASDSRPARILAVFVVDDDETELTIPDSK